MAEPKECWTIADGRIFWSKAEAEKAEALANLIAQVDEYTEWLSGQVDDKDVFLTERAISVRRNAIIAYLEWEYEARRVGAPLTAVE